MLKIYPPNLIPKSIQDEIAMKSMPIGAKEGDFVTVVLGGFQAATMILEVPSFEKTDGRPTHLGLGVILDDNDNPMTYRRMLRQIIFALQIDDHTFYDEIKKVPKKLVESFKRPRFRLKLANGKEILVELNEGITEGQRIREALKRL